MSHLDPERLAALADDTPTPVESAHLTTCDACSAELIAQRRLVRMAAAAGPLTDGPLSNFDALVPRLEAEGLIAPGGPARGDRSAGRFGRPRRSRSWRAACSRAACRWRCRGERRRTAPSASRRRLVDVAGAEPVASFRTPDDAVKALSLSQQTYQSAAAYLAAQDTTSHFIGLNENTYRTRLTALDDILAATRAALYQAPQDPGAEPVLPGHAQRAPGDARSAARRDARGRAQGELLMRARGRWTPVAARALVALLLLRRARARGAGGAGGSAAPACGGHPLRHRGHPRDSTIVRVTVNMDRIEQMIHDLMASKAMEQTIGSRCARRHPGRPPIRRSMRELSDELAPDRAEERRR